MAAVMASIPAPGPAQRPRLSLQTSNMVNNINMARPRLSIPSPQREMQSPAVSRPPQQQQQQPPQEQQQQRPPSPTRLSAAQRCATPVTAIKTRVQRLSLNTAIPGSTAPSQVCSTPVTTTPKRVKLSLRTATPTVSVPSFNLPETPLTAHPVSPDAGSKKPPLPRPQQQTLQPPKPWGASAMATPPLSAESGDAQSGSFSFSFAPGVGAPSTSPRPGLGRRHTKETLTPYVQPRSLHSVLRNSPLAGPSEMPARMWESRPAKQVSFRDPLTEEITNSRYTVSNIDMLESDDDASSVSSVDEFGGSNYTRDGGSTPGPWDDVQRRMACLAPSTPTVASGGPRKRKRKEKIRRWVWTIGVEGEEEEDESKQAGAIAALRAAEAAEDDDDDMTPAVTPTVARLAGDRYVGGDSDSDSAPTSCSGSPAQTPSVASAATTEDGEDVKDGDGDVDMDIGASDADVSDAGSEYGDEDVEMGYAPVNALNITVEAPVEVSIEVACVPEPAPIETVPIKAAPVETTCTPEPAPIETAPEPAHISSEPVYVPTAPKIITQLKKTDAAMDIDTPRTSVPPLSAISAFFSFNFAWPPRWWKSTQTQQTQQTQQAQPTLTQQTQPTQVQQTKVQQ